MTYQQRHKAHQPGVHQNFWGEGSDFELYPLTTQWHTRGALVGVNLTGLWSTPVALAGVLWSTPMAPAGVLWSNRGVEQEVALREGCLSCTTSLVPLNLAPWGAAGVPLPSVRGGRISY